MSVEQLTLAHPSLRYTDIDPRKNPAFSPNVYKYMKERAHFLFRGGVMDGLHRVKAGSPLASMIGAGTLMLGYEYDGDFIGSIAMQVLCNGKKAERYSYPGSTEMITDFWDRYLSVGRCAIDPEHSQHFIGDRYRYTDEVRVCLWCGIQHKKILTPRQIQVQDESWIPI